jgi:DNA (cytosine-5)-methyltransferase 1
MNKLKVVELFAGVGGFRIGLEKTKQYEVVWSNQWEPNKKNQHASNVYENRFGGTNHSNQDIEKVPTEEIPNHDVLVGGFPCQDYSVASLLKNSKGLLGKKGVLWWSIERILNEKKRKPHYLILENVDRLLNSPVHQKGRDFAVMLKSLDKLGYAVEWRIVNAGKYGMPQNRRRVFILGYHKSSKIYKEMAKSYYKDMENPSSMDWLHKTGVLANSLKVHSPTQLFPDQEHKLGNEITQVSKNFNKNTNVKFFQNTGLMIDGQIETIKTIPNFKGKKKPLKDIIETSKIDSKFYIDKKDEEKWKYEKGAKKKTRTKDGFTYEWAEGKMNFPDNLDEPSRTIITSEGGPSPSRIKHVINTKQGLRRLTPIELERLNMFPDNHTKLDGVSDNMRAFLMGNALVIGVVTKIGREIAKRVELT